MIFPVYVVLCFSRRKISFLDTVHVSLVEASGEMQMRFELWAIIMQIGKKCFLYHAPFGGSVFENVRFFGVEYKIQPLQIFLLNDLTCPIAICLLWVFVFLLLYDF